MATAKEDTCKSRFLPGTKRKRSSSSTSSTDAASSLPTLPRHASTTLGARIRRRLSLAATKLSRSSLALHDTTATANEKEMGGCASSSAAAAADVPALESVSLDEYADFQGQVIADLGDHGDDVRCSTPNEKGVTSPTVVVENWCHLSADCIVTDALSASVNAQPASTCSGTETPPPSVTQKRKKSRDHSFLFRRLSFLKRRSSHSELNTPKSRHSRPSRMLSETALLDGSDLAIGSMNLERQKSSDACLFSRNNRLRATIASASPSSARLDRPSSDYVDFSLDDVSDSGCHPYDYDDTILMPPGTANARSPIDCEVFLDYGMASPQTSPVSPLSAGFNVKKTPKVIIYLTINFCSNIDTCIRFIIAVDPINDFAGSSSYHGYPGTTNKQRLQGESKKQCFRLSSCSGYIYWNDPNPTYAVHHCFLYM